MKSNRKKYNKNKSNRYEFTVENLSKAIFVVNKHAKTALDPKFLYDLKKVALEKMLKDGQAEKIGLHFSKSPKFSQQSSSVLISCGEYLFHLPPSRDDFRVLSHLGDLDKEHRNPKTNLNLVEAKTLLIAYTGINQPQSTNVNTSYTNKRLSPFVKRFGER